MITLLEMVASNGMSAPLELATFSVISASTFVSLSTLLSINRIASLAVTVILLFAATPVAPLAGLKVSVGASVSAAVNFKDVLSLIPA